MNTPEQYWVDHPLLGVEDYANEQARQFPVYEELAQQIVDLDASRVLDIGGNIGTLGWYIHRIDPDIRYYVLDNNPAAVQAAIDRDTTASVGNIRKLTQKPRYYDTVVLKDVLEHLESFTLLAEPFRIAGMYVVVCSYIPWILGENHPPTTQHSDGYYENTYHLEDIARWANSKGWKVQRVTNVKDREDNDNGIVVFARMTEEDVALYKEKVGSEDIPIHSK